MKRSHANTGATQRKAKKQKKEKPRVSEVESKVQTDDELDLDKILESVASGQSELNSQNQTINILKKQVSELQAMVGDLRAQIDFLMSAFDWTMQRPASLSNHPAPVDGPAEAATASVKSGAATAVTSGGPVNQSSPFPSQWTEVGRRQTKAQTKTQRNIRDAVVAAVYVDEQRKSSRMANLVVSGLPSMLPITDQTLVTDLFRNEIGVDAEVVWCKRLGRILAGRVQPLLVTMRSADQADLIMAKAKNLRQSTHSVVKDNVYINRHLTEAQSRAAYELRCERRAAGQRRNRGTASASARGVAGPEAATLGVASTSSMAADLGSQGLRVTAAEFTPTVSAASD